jgi:hypothetical protein
LGVDQILLVTGGLTVMTDEMESDRQTMTVTATCGHEVTFAVNLAKPMAGRIAKHRDLKCGPCRIADDEARRAAGWIGPGKVRKGQEPKHLPPGALIVLRMEEDRTWVGQLQAEGITVNVTGAGLMGMASKLAKAWLREKGVAVKK